MVTFEGLEDCPPEPPINCDTIEGGRYRDFLNTVSPDDFRDRIAQIASVTNLCALPPTNYNIGTILLATVSHGEPKIMLPKTAKKVDENFLELKSVTPQNYEGDDIIHAYFKGTPLALMADIFHDDTVSIPDALRIQHHIIVGSSGHGKTQCLQEMILKDIEDDDACVIVMDSQGEMLEKLLHVVSWDRCMYLDGGNLHQPLGLGAFEIGSTLRIEDEPKLRTAVALYEHMFSSRETKLTTKQSTLYRYLSRFLMVIPGANFDTALQILEHGCTGFEAHISKLDTTSQTFIQSNLDDPKAKGASQAYKQTRQEVAQRIYTLLESRAISQMFNAPVSKVDIGHAIKDDRIILINTAQAVLGEEGASLFGRYCLAQIAMEVLGREPTQKRVYFYIDEAQEYLSGDPVIHRLFEQGRKRGLCMVCAFHRLGQVPELEDMLKTLTSIKFAGGVSASDAAKLAKELDTDAETIRAQPELSFWAWFRGQGNGV
ncbi:MAG: type IV secretion system DNA-binding domain-containing protein, partial [Pseudomonadota bacterium]